MEHKRKNKTNNFTLIVIPIIIAIYIAFYAINSSWIRKNPVQASTTFGTETQANVSTPTTQDITDTAIDSEGNNIIVWSATGASLTDTSGKGVYYRRFDKNNTALDVSDVLVNTSTTSDQTDPKIAMDEDGNFIIIWEGNGTQTGQTDANGIFAQAFQSDGTTIGGEIRVNTTTANVQNEAAIAIDKNGPNTTTRFVISWTNDNGTDNDILFQRFDIDFTQTTTPASTAGSETTANTYTTNNQETSEVAMNNLGEYIVTWYGDNGSGNNVMYQIYAQNGTTIGSNTAINTATAVTSGGAAADKTERSSLNDTNARRFILAYETLSGGNDTITTKRITCTDPNTTNGVDTDLNCSADSTEIFVNTDLTGSQSSAKVDADYLGNFTVTWTDDNADINSTGIMAQSYTYLGKRINSNFTVNTSTTGAQSAPAIAMNTDGFYLISFTNGNDSNNYYQNYITEIFKTDSESLSHTTSANNQANVDTAVSPGGNYAVVWTDYNANSIQLSLYQFNPTSYPANYTTLLSDSTVSSAGNVDNPSISFFKDTSGSNIGKFIIVWESDTDGDKEIYYRTYNADGSADIGVTQITTNSDTDILPDVAAGTYNTGVEFAIGWQNSTTTSIEAGYNNSGFTFNTLDTCPTSCNGVKVDLEPSTNTAIYAYQEKRVSTNEISIRQTTSGALTGSAVEVTATGVPESGSPDVTFISSNDYVVTYTEINGATSDVYGITYEFGGSGPTNAGTRFDMTQFSASSNTEFNTNVTGDATNEQFLAVWTDTPSVSTDNHIFGQFYNYTGTGGTNVEIFGPTFHINSTKSGNQTIPAVHMNESGQATVAWEGNYNQSGTSDSNAAIHQLLQNPQNLQGVQALTPTAQQIIQAGGQFLVVPTTITFPDVTLSATDNTVQAVSTRDAVYGGDTKYVEVQDATGVDFTLSIQTTDFFSTADNKAYIKNDQHFKVRNWDQDTTDIDNVTTCTGDPDTCYTTIQSTVTPTAFSLNSATTSFVFADTQKVLVDKTGTTNNEIGRWRFYPEFQITVPPLIPPGSHSAEITFTLT